jgi:beta-glucosidase
LATTILPAGWVVTWPRSLDQLPPMMDYDIRHGHSYMYFRLKPLYPFGYGLSYTRFAYSNLRTSSEQMKRDDEITVSVDVRNTGSRAGDEVVQMYVAHLNSKVERPIEELKGFKRIALQPGETNTVALPLKASALAYWNSATGAFEVEADRINVKVGSSSADFKLQQLLGVTPE